MKTLTNKAYISARNYLETQGRTLDQTWFRMEFEKGEKTDFYQALKAYQWDNGGFGYRLEPDHRTLLPSCYTTSLAFQWMDKLALPQDDLMMEKALSYFQEQYNPQTHRWPAFPPAANKDPHAIWWHFEEGQDLCIAEQTWGLASAEILGIMMKVDGENPLWKECFEFALQRLDEVYPDMDKSEASFFYRMLYYLDETKKQLVLKKLSGILEYIIEADETQWNHYTAKPLMYFDHPDAPLASSFMKLIDKNLDWEIEQQQPDGSWEPNWQWFRDEKNWPEAKREWKSYLTMEKLLILKRFGRLE